MLAILLVSCSGTDGPSGQAPDIADPPKQIEVRVMTFNIEWGGTNISFDSVVEAIRRSNADIVGIQEADGNLERLATALGWQFDRRNYVISRFPLVDPPGADGKYVLAEVSPGYAIAVANLHLPSDPYGPDLIRDGAPLEVVLANEQANRMPTLQQYLEKLPALSDAGLPTIVTGDFNSPSHTDWSAAMVGKRKFQLYAVAWPVSLAMQQAGFQDSWRMLFPDAAKKPGLTWWAGRPPLEAYAPGDNDAQDRIDQIWYSGSVLPLSAQLVGEVGGPEVTVSVTPWPSDHRGVVTTFAVDPARLPNLITSDRRVYREGDKVRMTYHFTGASELDISLKDFGSNRPILTRHTNQASGQFDLPSVNAGHYLVETTVGRETYRREFWVQTRDAVPVIEVARTRFRTNEPVEFHWRNAPGNRNDYIAIYSEDNRHDAEAMLAYDYVDALPEGTLSLSTFVPSGGWYLSSGGYSVTPGRYSVKLMKDDGYEVLAESGLFEVY